MSRSTTIIVWIAQIIAAVIMAQTLFFKFSGAPEPIHIFTTLGVEPWGRWFAGISEFIAAALLLIPRTAAIGGLMTVGIMLGAIIAHLGPLGVVVLDDGGALFIMAILVTIAAGIVTWIRRASLPIIGAKFSAKTAS